MSELDIVNFGCRLNLAEGEAIRQAALGTAGNAGLTVINSCAVTNEAERQARQMIRRIARADPARRIVVTGCAAETARDRFAAMPEVSGIVGNADKRDGTVWADVAGHNPTALFGGDRAFIPVTSGQGHARAFVAVQTGCDHRCTFCIIPFGRGNARSAHPAAVVEAVAAAVARGQREVVLTGVDLTSYGHDLLGQPPLGELVETILAGVPGLDRLRLSSLDSVEIDDRLFDLITSERRVMPHVHLSLQSGDDMILKRMKRRHARADAVALVNRLKSRRPDIAIGADIIAGFPTESDAMFANSLAMIDDCDIVFAHVFPYSPRSSTPAARMPQLDRAMIRDRAAALRAAAATRAQAWRTAQVGTRHAMLVENDGLTGHAENFLPLRLSAPAIPGSIISVIVGDTDGAAMIDQRPAA